MFGIGIGEVIWGFLDFWVRGFGNVGVGLESVIGFFGIVGCFGFLCLLFLVN